MAALAALLRTTQPHELSSVEGLRHRFQNEPPEAHLAWWGAFENGTLVGYGQAFVRWHTGRSELGSLSVGVAEAARRRGIGSVLFDVALDHLRGVGVRRVWASVVLDDGRNFLEHRGFAELSRDRGSELDLSSVDPMRLAPPALGDGFRVEPLRALGPSPPLHELYVEALQDIPGEEVARSFAYDVWVERNLSHPNLDWDGSFIVLDGERPVAFSFLLVDREGGVGYSEMTGTARDYRGRGLAFAAKVETIRWALANGLRELRAGNDTRNAPMLAINDKLGYRPAIFVREYVCDLGAAGE